MLPSYYVGDLATTVTPPTGSTTFTVSVTKSGTGSGTVSGGTISCGATCSATLAAGTVVNLSATPSTGSTFTGWGGACSGASACAVTLNANATVSAGFDTVAGTTGGTGGTPSTPVTHTINVTSAGNYDTTSISIHVGDSLKFVYTPPYGAEVRTQFTPAGISSVTIDKDITTRTVTISSAGTWTFKAADHNGNQGTLIVQ
jgi:hypothetical protein